MFFDNIFGTSDNNNSNNDNYDDKSLDNREGKVCPVTGLIPCKCNDSGENDRYSLKNISLRQGRAFLKDEKKLNRMNTYLAQNTGDKKIARMSIEGFDNGSQQPQAADSCNRCLWLLFHLLRNERNNQTLKCKDDQPVDNWCMHL